MAYKTYSITFENRFIKKFNTEQSVLSHFHTIKCLLLAFGLPGDLQSFSHGQRRNDQNELVPYAEPLEHFSQ